MNRIFFTIYRVTMYCHITPSICYVSAGAPFLINNDSANKCERVTISEMPESENTTPTIQV